MQLENPMSADQSVMRTCLLPGLATALQTNVARQATRLRLFEVGLCFQPDAQGGLIQQQVLGGALWGTRRPQNWSQASAAVDFFDTKGDVERLLVALGVAGSGVALQTTAASHPAFHPGLYAQLHLGSVLGSTDAGSEPIGRLGRLHPEVEARLEIDGPVYLFELRTSAILQHAKPRYRAVSRYPRVRRDLALVVAREVSAAHIEALCRAALGENLVDFTLFDVYTGKGIDFNEKSIAVGLTLQAPSATLSEAEIGQFLQRVLSRLKQDAGARLR
jgi:phenylalanyl-tRNA synthetase beta chain